MRMPPGPHGILRHNRQDCFSVARQLGQGADAFAAERFPHTSQGTHQRIEAEAEVQARLQHTATPPSQLAVAPALHDVNIATGRQRNYGRAGEDLVCHAATKKTA